MVAQEMKVVMFVQIAQGANTVAKMGAHVACASKF
jgi:hypothetical protein